MLSRNRRYQLSIGIVFVVISLASVAAWRFLSSGSQQKQPLTAQSNEPHGQTSEPSGIETIKHSTENSMGVSMYRGLFDKMVVASQPRGYSILKVVDAPNGNRTAFLCFDSNRTGHVIVRDRNASKDADVLPSLSEHVYSTRNIQGLQWDETGKLLYILESANDSTAADLDALSPTEEVAYHRKDYSLFYSCSPDDEQVRMLDRIHSPVLSVTSGDGAMWLVSRSLGKGDSFVDLRKYRDGKRVSMQTVSVTLNGQATNVLTAQFLSKWRELWFTALVEQTDHSMSKCLGVLDLAGGASVGRLIASDVRSCEWDSNEDRLAFEQLTWKGDNKEKSGPVSISVVLLHHDALDRPITVTEKEFAADVLELPIIGFGSDGRDLFFRGLTKAVLTKGERLSDPTITTAYRLTLPVQ